MVSKNEVWDVIKRGNLGVIKKLIDKQCLIVFSQEEIEDVINNLIQRFSITNLRQISAFMISNNIMVYSQGEEAFSLLRAHLKLNTAIVNPSRILETLHSNNFTDVMNVINLHGLYFLKQARIPPLAQDFTNRYSPTDLDRILDAIREAHCRAYPQGKQFADLIEKYRKPHGGKPS